MDDTNEIIARSSVRSAKVALNGTYNPPVNLRLLLDKDAEDTAESKNILYDPSAIEGSDLIVVPGSGLDDLPLEAPPLHDASDHTPARFKSLRNEIKNAEGQAVGLSIDPTGLLGYAFVQDKDGLKQKATVIDANTDIDLVTLEYLSGHQDVIEYNELINIINALEDVGDGIWTFKRILGHKKKGVNGMFSSIGITSILLGSPSPKSS